MSPKIAIIITPDGIETVAILSKKNKDRKKAINLCSLLETEIRKFEDSIIKKTNTMAHEDDIKK